LPWCDRIGPRQLEYGRAEPYDRHEVFTFIPLHSNATGCAAYQ